MFLYVLSGEFDSGPEIWVRRLAAYGTKMNHHDIFQAVHNSFGKLLSKFCVIWPTDDLICVIFPGWKRFIFVEIR